MESKIKFIEVNSNEFQPVKDRSIIISLSHKFKTEVHLLKIKAPDYISKFFQEINDHEYALDIEDIIPWYSELDEQTKTEITSFNSRELIQLLCNKIIKDKTIKTKPAPKDELESETNNIKTSNYDDTPTQELFYQEQEQEQEQYESDSNLAKDTEFQNLETNEETTKDTENEEEQYINKNLIKEEDLSKSTKACSLEDDDDTLIFNIKSDTLKEYLNCFPKEGSTIRPIIPKLINNTWHITLPDWTNLPKKLSFGQIMACIFILLHFEYICLTRKKYEMPFYKKLRGISHDNEIIMNELFTNKVDVTNDIFNEYNSFYIAKKCTHNFIERYFPKDKNFDSDELFYFNKYILKNLKNEISKYNTNKEKLKILFLIISFYSLEDLINSKHFIYNEIKNFLINYNGFAQEIDANYRNIQYNNKILEPIRKEYLEKTKRLLKKILGPQIEIVEYGSYFTGLSTELSDMDLLIFAEKIKDETEFGKYLKNVLEKENLNIEAHLDNLNAPPVITISYYVSEKYLTGINFSVEYLDGIKDLNRIKIDITFTNDKERVKNTKEIVRIIKEALKTHKQLKPIILYLKTYFKKHKMYSTYKGGINSLSIFCLARNILVTYEKYGFDVNLFPKEKILFLITEKFGYYNYRYGIDKDGFDYTLKGKEIVNEDDHRLVIKSPVDNEKNIAKGSFRSQEIIEKFRFLFSEIKKKVKFFLKN